MCVEVKILLEVLAVTAFQVVSIYSSGREGGTETRETRVVPTDT